MRIRERTLTPDLQDRVDGVTQAAAVLPAGDREALLWKACHGKRPGSRSSRTSCERKSLGMFNEP
jgi:hypothetical protein